MPIATRVNESVRSVCIFTFSGNGIAGTLGLGSGSGSTESVCLIRFAAVGDSGSSLAFRLPSFKQVSLYSGKNFISDLLSWFILFKSASPPVGRSGGGKIGLTKRLGATTVLSWTSLVESTTDLAPGVDSSATCTAADVESCFSHSDSTEWMTGGSCSSDAGESIDAWKFWTGGIG